MSFYVHYLDADGNATIVKEFETEALATQYAEYFVGEMLQWCVCKLSEVNYIDFTQEQRDELSSECGCAECGEPIGCCECNKED